MEFLNKIILRYLTIFFTLRLKMSNFDFLKINVASPKRIKSWGTRTLSDGIPVGELLNPDTLYYRDLRPIVGGLFCDRIFGPLKILKCRCCRYKGIRRKNQICPKCGIEVKLTRLGRRHYLGLITLHNSVVHIWFLLGRPSYLTRLVMISTDLIISIIYHEAYLVVTPDLETTSKKRILEKHDVLSQCKWKCFARNKRAEKNLRPWDQPPTKARVKIGAKGISYLLTQNWKVKHKRLRVALERAERFFSIVRVLLRHPRRTRHFLQRGDLKRLRLYKNELKRLKLITQFIRGRTRPAWMLLKAIPVLPPNLRPMMRSNRLVLSADLNDLYRIVIMRNNRSQVNVDHEIPTKLSEVDRILLQDAIDKLIQNGKRGSIYTGGKISENPLKSLTDMLVGKTGRFRQNLLGKRVDYSGRSVIVVGPPMSHFECGLPRDLAIILFEFFAVHVMIQEKVTNYLSAMDTIEARHLTVWPYISKAIMGHPVLLNRAPTLHRLNIQAFLPQLVNEQALYLHPLVCTGYNADFDGDQMAVHLPLALEVQYEALNLLPVHNFWSSSTGELALPPSQDIVLGSIYLTDKIPRRQLKNPVYFPNFSEVLIAYYNSKITLHTFVWVRFKKTYGSEIGISTILIDHRRSNFKKLQFGSQVLYSHPLVRFKENSNSLYVATTPGRILLNCTFELTSDVIKT